MTDDRRPDPIAHGCARLPFAAMRERGLDPDFSPAELAEAAALRGAAATSEAPTRDLRPLLWCSIDNDDSRDLDQLSVAEALAGGAVKVLRRDRRRRRRGAEGSPVDRHAAHEHDVGVHAGVIFPMLPERLSTDLTSLNEHEDRLAVVIEFVVSPDGEVAASDVYGALVRNHAKLAYNAVGAWLERRAVRCRRRRRRSPGMDEQLRMQDRVAQALSRVRARARRARLRDDRGRAVFDGDTLRELRPQVGTAPRR